MVTVIAGIVVVVVSVVVVIIIIVMDISIIFLFGPQEHQGAPIWRRRGTLADWQSTEPWVKIGTLGCEGQDAEDPKDDIPETWGVPPLR